MKLQLNDAVSLCFFALPTGSCLLVETYTLDIIKCVGSSSSAATGATAWLLFFVPLVALLLSGLLCVTTIHINQ